MSDSQMVTINGESISLEALAGIDLTEVKEVRSNVCAAGMFHWRIKEAKMTAISVEDKDNIGTKIDKPVIQFELEAQNCLSLVDDTLSPADYVGEIHFESFWITNLQKDLGKVKAFLVDIGIDGNKPVTELLDLSHGHEFVCTITNTPDKNNPDRIYANRKDVMKMEEYAELAAKMQDPA